MLHTAPLFWQAKPLIVIRIINNVLISLGFHWATHNSQD